MPRPLGLVSYYFVVTRDPIRIFIAYARTDSKLREEFGEILATWQRDGTVVVWADSKLIGAPSRPLVTISSRAATPLRAILEVAFCAYSFQIPNLQ
jgi:hypothetical protein